MRAFVVHHDCAVGGEPLADMRRMHRGVSRALLSVVAVAVLWRPVSAPEGGSSLAAHMTAPHEALACMHSRITPSHGEGLQVAPRVASTPFSHIHNTSLRRSHSTRACMSDCVVVGSPMPPPSTQRVLLASLSCNTIFRLHTCWQCLWLGWLSASCAVLPYA